MLEKQKLIRTVSGLLISGIAIYFLFREINYAEFIKSFKHISCGWAMLSILAFFISLFMRTIVWRFLVNDRTMNLKKSFQILLISSYFNNILPARIGDLTRIYLSWRDLKISRPVVILSVLLEKIIDIIWLIFLLLVALIILGRNSFLFYKNAVLFIEVGIALLVASVLILKFKDLIRRVLTSKFNRRNQHTSKIAKLVMSLFKIIDLIPSFKIMITAYVFHGLTWFFSLLTIWFAMRSFGFSVTFIPALAILVFTNLGMIIPSSPGALGVYQYLAYLALMIFSIDHQTAISFAVYLHLIQYIPNLLVGFVSWMLYQKNATNSKKIQIRNFLLFKEERAGIHE